VGLYCVFCPNHLASPPSPCHLLSTFLSPSLSVSLTTLAMRLRLSSFSCPPPSIHAADFAALNAQVFLLFFFPFPPKGRALLVTPGQGRIACSKDDLFGVMIPLSPLLLRSRRLPSLPAHGKYSLRRFFCYHYFPLSPVYRPSGRLASQTFYTFLHLLMVPLFVQCLTPPVK